MVVAAFEDLTSTRLESGSQHGIVEGEDYEDRMNHINHNLHGRLLLWGLGREIVFRLYHTLSLPLGR